MQVGRPRIVGSSAAGMCSSPKRLDRLRGPQNLLYNYYSGLYPGIKWRGHEVDHSPLSSAERKSGAITPPPPYAFRDFTK